MADKKVTELTAITRVSGDDLLLVVNDPLGTPASRKVTLSNFFANVSVDQVYTAESTFKANTTFSGTKVAMNANLMFSGASDDAYTMIKDRYQVANVDAKFFNSTLTGNTNLNGLTSSNVFFLKTTVSSNTPLTTNTALENMHGSASNRNIPAGTIWVANSFIYVATDSTNIKRTRIAHYPTSVRFILSASSGNTAWNVNGGGAIGSNNETLYVYKGLTYEFRTPLAHPFEIQSANGAAYANGYNRVNARTHYFTVPQNQSSNLYYQCTTHAAMKGTIVIV